jgi:hypothetical protein
MCFARGEIEHVIPEWELRLPYRSYKKTGDRDKGLLEDSVDVEVTAGDLFKARGLRSDKPQSWLMDN